uniref:Macrosialin n=1 Tax=Catagonus wagneri TaxID=51154 RepID=A0A8C3VX87_9CETA
MRLAVLFSGALLGLLTAQGAGANSPHKKSATLLPSFTVTPTATESTASPGTTSHRTTTPRTSTSHESTTATHNPTTTTSHRNVTVHPTSSSTATSPGSSTRSPHPRPPPPSPSPSPGSKEATGDYTWTNGSQPCVQLQAQIQMRVLYPTQDGGETKGTRNREQHSCVGTHPHVLLSFPYGQLSFGFKQEPLESTVYLDYMAVEYNVSFPRAAQWTFSVQNSSLRDLQTPVGRSYSCRNASIVLSPAFHLDLLSLKLQAAQLPPTGAFGPSFSCPSDQSILLPLIIGLIFLGLLTLVLVTFCIVRRRPPTYQPL